MLLNTEDQIPDYPWRNAAGQAQMENWGTERESPFAVRNYSKMVQVSLVFLENVGLNLEFHLKFMSIHCLHDLHKIQSQGAMGK